MALPECMLRVGKEVETYCEGQSLAGTPPCIVYLYPPQDEYTVRAELDDLRRWLQSRDIHPVVVSLAELFWQAIDESGFAEQIEQAEKSGQGDPDVLCELHNSIRQILLQPPSLADRVLAVLENAPERSAAFLYRAGALYPCFRTSSLLDELRERIQIPLALLYPGRLVGDYGLSFMGRCQPVHGYRATIIARENR